MAEITSYFSATPRKHSVFQRLRPFFL